MTDTEPRSGPASRGDHANAAPQSAGERLRAAREAQGLSLADVAARTRVPIRHLEAIESGDYSNLPTPTYAIGFAKAYARAVGEDEVTIARDVRTRTASISAERQEYQPYELDDPTRVPPRGLAIVAGLVGVVVLIVALVWIGSTWFVGGSSDTASETAAASNPVPAAKPMVTQPVPAAASQVTLTALDRVWVRVHDGAGKTLYQNTMNAGDSFAVPPGADHPQLTVGRPDKLRVSLNGTALAPLGSGARPMKDVPIDAAALSARAAAAPAPTASPSAAATPAASTSTPTPAATPTPKSTPTPRAKETPKPKPSPSKSPKTPEPKASPAALPPPTGIY
jgi:transcriptional regulator with XRE-family HTH domain